MGPGGVGVDPARGPEGVARELPFKDLDAATYQPRREAPPLHPATPLSQSLCVRQHARPPTKHRRSLSVPHGP